MPRNFRRELRRAVRRHRRFPGVARSCLARRSCATACRRIRHRDITFLFCLSFLSFFTTSKQWQKRATNVACHPHKARWSGDTRCLFRIFFSPFCQQLAIPSSGLHVSWRQAVHLTTAHLPEKSRKREKMLFKEHSRSFVVLFLSLFLRTYLYLFRSIRTRRTCGDEHSLSTPDPKNNLHCAFH